MMTPGIKKIVVDAKSAGYEITIVKDGMKRIEVLKRHKGHGGILAGIIIWEDGTATRADVDLTITTAIRTQKAMRRILGI